MGHADAMADRLPPLYREGRLIRGVLEVPAVQLEILDEDAREVQRSHWFDMVLELEEAARLAAILNIDREPWQADLGTFRSWVHAVRSARLKYGSVAKRALQEFVAEYSREFQAVKGLRTVPPISSWQETAAVVSENDLDEDRPDPVELVNGVHIDGPAFIENPPKQRYNRAPAIGGIEPLHRFSIEQQRGLDETHAGFLLVGLPTAPESVPVIANLTTGEALIFMGNVPPGQRLWIRPNSDGTITANLEGVDVTSRCRSVADLHAGTPWDNAAVQQPAQAISLRRGKNDIWFLPVAHFDAMGLDRFLLALADFTLRQGRYDETNFDESLFYQAPAVVFHMTWLETQPASVEVHLPAASLLSPQDGLTESLEDRDLLTFGLETGVQQLKAAGVQSSVVMRTHGEVQRQLDLLTAVLPMTHREIGPMGADRLPDAGGLFEVTDFNDSTFR